MLLFPEVTAAVSAAEAIRGRVVAARQFMMMATEPPAGQAVGLIKLDFERFRQRSRSRQFEADVRCGHR